MSWQRCLLFVVPLALLALLGRWTQTVLDAPNFDWAGARLMPLVTLGEQGNLYMPAHSGPVYNTIYSPLSYLLYWPATWADDPVAIIACASALGLLFYFAPLLLFFLAPLAPVLRGEGTGVRGSSSVGQVSNLPFCKQWQVGNLPHGRKPRSTGGEGGKRAPLALALFFLFGLLSYQSRALRMSLEGTIHDCPSLGLAALACTIAYHDRQAKRLAWSALFALLAVWSKQVMFPLLVALPLFTTVAHGWRAALRQLAYLGLGGSVSALTLFYFTDRNSLYFNVVTLPARHPWVGTFPGNWLAVAYHFYDECWLALAAVGVLVCIERPWREGANRRWLLFLLVAACQVPAAFLARLKVGGSSNSFSPVLYFLLLGLLVYLVEFLRDPQRSQSPQRGVGITLNGALLALALLQSLQTANFLKSFPGIGRSKEQQVVDYIRAHPGEAYFPWHPLAHQAAEGRTCHFAYGLFDRELGGCAIGDEHLKQHVPPQCRYVCFPPGRRHQRTPDCLERLLRDYGQRVEIDELPGFECYERPP